MRKAIALVVLAASTALSVPAFAQEADAPVGERYERIARENQERYEARQQRQAERAERRQSVDSGAVVQPDRAERRAQREERQERREVREDRRADRRDNGGWQGNPNDPRMEAIRRRYERLETQNAINYGTQDQRREAIRERRRDLREDRREWRQDRREGDGGWRRDRREWRDDRRDFRNDLRDNRRDRWDRSWRNDRRYDWSGYRDYNRNLFRAPRYYSPYGYGYGYRRFGIGSVLDSLFWGRNYWINDPWQYRLPRAPVGYVWVRYYNDVVLVDQFDGRIVDVIHDFFW